MNLNHALLGVFSLKFCLRECFIIAKFLIIMYNCVLETLAVHINYRKKTKQLNAAHLREGAPFMKDLRENVTVTKFVC